jgi:serine/threonine protein kinase
MAGPWFTILGAVFTDKWIVQRLTDFIWVGLDATLNEPHCNRVAHIMHSLRRNVEKLRGYYVGLKVIATDPEDLHPRFFPSIRAYRDEDRIVEFKYTKPLELDSTCVTFLAKTTSGIPKDIVVKFVQRYGEAAHRLLTRENLALQLFYYGKLGVLEGDPSYGHLRMVVMEYIDGETIAKVTRRIPPTWVDQVRRALDILHSHGYIFGDLRQPNIMVTKNREVKLIDFDWAGIQQVSRYPLLISPSIVASWRGGFVHHGDFT